MVAGTHPIKFRYDYARLERNALELAEGCEAGAREALLEMAARFRDEASTHTGASSKKLFPIGAIVTSAVALLSFRICPRS
ncbi:hypothetical protein ACVWZ6_006997 [Bradyrhizobium sp. GM6.1]